MPRRSPDTEHHNELQRRERELRLDGYRFVAGTDEAGAGPLAGPLVAAAVVLRSGNGLLGVDDSKCLTARQRNTLAEAIRERAVSWSVAVVSAAEVDEVGPLVSAVRGMTRAVMSLAPPPDYVLIDARRLPEVPYPQQAVVGGDRRHLCIAAASILAKVYRDELMLELDARYPGYGFAQHKGYGTSDHLAALASLGPSPEHRRRYAPVREVLGESPRLSF
ncbi:MAG: ribonuclease HII [Acidobacteria bacterium]|jgi:ribonuclease HII|nr:ribonuclease HII [Acidobacteriota bacterium]